MKKEASPLEGIKRAITVFVNVCTLLFALTVIGVLVWGTPAATVRLGAFWIAVVLFSFGFIKLIVSHIFLASQGKGAAVAIFEKKLGAALHSEDKGWLNYMDEAGKGYEHPLYTREEVGEFLEDLEHHVSHHVVPTDIILVACATLLTGFGDLLFCLFRTIGNPLCCC